MQSIHTSEPPLRSSTNLTAFSIYCRDSSSYSVKTFSTNLLMASLLSVNSTPYSLSNSFLTPFFVNLSSSAFAHIFLIDLSS